MTNFIRAISAFAFAVLTTLFLFKIFGDIKPKKGVALVFLVGMGVGVYVFWELSKYELNSKLQRSIGLLSIAFALLGLIYIFMVQGVSHVVYEMLNRYNRMQAYAYWILISLIGIFPLIAFKFDTFFTPLSKWLNAPSSSKNKDSNEST